VVEVVVAIAPKTASTTQAQSRARANEHVSTSALQLLQLPHTNT
jgi:hypothetical protein